MLSLRSIVSRCAILAMVVIVSARAGSGQERLRLATTTSTENTGLLEVLLPPFEMRFDARVDVIAVGTGKALRLGENGDVDVILVHDPAAEEQFLNSGYGVNRRAVMHNDFVMVGPEEDPAGIRDSVITSAFSRIAAGQWPFVSRGDASGTHIKEKELWGLSKVSPSGTWYIETGQGMGATLLMADQKKAYCLTDRGTYLAFAGKIDLVVLCQGDARLDNRYSIIAVNPGRYPHLNYILAMAFIGWVTSPEGQKIIGEFSVNGHTLFHPNACTPMPDSTDLH